MSLDATIFTWINSFAGHFPVLDEIVRGLANDYFTIISCCLILIALWFGTPGKIDSIRNQTGVIVAASSLGIAQAIVGIINVFCFRVRPFNAMAVNLIFYPPTDSSFPSNAAAIVFALAMGVFLYNKKAGILLLTIGIIHGLARIYVGIHYPLDILGGAAIGIITALIMNGIAVWQKPNLNKLLGLMERVHLT